VGVTAHRASQLGTITNQTFSVGNNSDVSATTGVCTITGNGDSAVHAALHGTLRNERLLDNPGNIGTDPWNSDLFTIEAANPNDYNSLMTASQYDALNNS
jgi:glycine cleavage system H lipoate-binding protein